MNAGVLSIMCSYNSVNGIHGCENRKGLYEDLRKGWGFKGFVVSDWFGARSTVQSFKGGLDVEMPIGEYVEGFVNYLDALSFMVILFLSCACRRDIRICSSLTNSSALQTYKCNTNTNKCNSNPSKCDTYPNMNNNSNCQNRESPNFPTLPPPTNPLHTDTTPPRSSRINSSAARSLFFKSSAL